MSDARHDLRSAIHGVLIADPWLDGWLAGGKVHDRVPRGAPFPFLALGETASEPLDADDPPTVEHRLEIFVHSREGGQREASEIADRVRALLDDAALALADHRIVSIRHRDTVVRSERDGRSYQARLRFRALTEGN